MKLSKVWMLISLCIIIVLSILTKSSVLQIIAAISGVIYVFNTIFENRYGQIFGIINSALYGYIMFKNGIYGTAVYDIIYCIPMQVYTFFTWGKNKEGKNKIEVSKYTNSQRLLLVCGTICVILIYAFVANSLNVNFALVDGISIILGFLGLYFTSKKKVEQWYCFLIANIAMLVLWGIKCIETIENIPMLLMWIVYFVNNSYGLFIWSKKLKENSTKNNEINDIEKHAETL